ncbi:hypothetical protein [Actinacidiphila oryziradicis]|uniref:Uncharacterized protein n=1 Tax=Actinacidiphila oryziradicis TaxID=2571141 RepID=A0A4U0RSF1_9ACTN|nr:hypothetical protein [Actinacidiphila oryziradicis]TJZ98989.1 hypothetical protein FCI23_47340 [Actinacidiphila oryziradicis]
MTDEQRSDIATEFGWGDEEIVELARQNAEQLGGALNAQVLQPFLEHAYQQAAEFERALREISAVVTGLHQAVEALGTRVTELEEGR